jgi:hypothetical protein
MSSIGAAACGCIVHARDAQPRTFRSIHLTRPRTHTGTHETSPSRHAAGHRHQRILHRHCANPRQCSHTTCSFTHLDRSDRSDDMSWPKVVLQASKLRLLHLPDFDGNASGPTRRVDPLEAQMLTMERLGASRPHPRLATGTTWPLSLAPIPLRNGSYVGAC